MSIEIREVDDWVAVYKDGNKVWENHSCSLVDGLSALGIDFVRKTLDEGDFEFNADTLTIRDVTSPDLRADAFPESL